MIWATHAGGSSPALAAPSRAVARLTHEHARCFAQGVRLRRFGFPVAPGCQFQGITSVVLAIWLQAASTKVHPGLAITGDGGAWRALWYTWGERHAVLLQGQRL